MNRYSLRIWASGVDAEVTDPDLDAAHPGGNGGAGKYAKGWVPEKEPHQWINYLYKAQESALADGMSVGGMIRDATVQYKLGALSLSATGVWQTATKDNPATADWVEVAASNSKSVFNTWYNDNVGAMNGHMARVGPTDNPHNTTIGQAGGYTKQEIESKDNTNSADVKSHMEDVNNPHKVTYVQINCLSATLGGKFTGQVFLPEIILSTGIGVRGTELYTSKEGMGLTSVPWLSATNQEILTENSYPRLRTKYEPLFALPPEDISIPLAGSLTSATSGAFVLTFERPTTLAYTDRSGASMTAPIDEPAFEVAGLKLAAGSKLILSGNMNGMGTLYFERDGVVQVYDVNLNSTDLIADYFGDVGNVKNVRIWMKILTAEQKSMLGV